MGYHVARVSPPGLDKGINVVAHTDRCERWRKAQRKRREMSQAAWKNRSARCKKPTVVSRFWSASTSAEATLEASSRASWTDAACAPEAFATVAVVDAVAHAADAAKGF